MALTSQEIDSARFHLGYGNIQVGAEPYTPDTFLALFEQVVSTYLSTGTDTTATTAITAKTTVAVIPVDMTDIDVNVRLVIDTAEQAEIVVVKAVTATTFTAYFAKAHAVTGYPVATLSGLGRLRMMLHAADAAWASMTDVSVANTSGLKSVDKADVVWFDGLQVLKGRMDHYRSVVASISSLLRIPYLWHFDQRTTSSLEAY